ncbi:cytochrome d ubiquinol oxidase subunit II [Streptomyces sp. H27-C3]|uniref:cytochrome d ubiquinol oxidase subunit II n=1 Tax=Streptomyces sp. H27-C3 TaxID=3046305 RepID=UPI0024BA37A0|nr:cytochrome d ubiquinol oxidase subunit II [Streptomyces sp. H27-C3]MDJ0466231.1 cytochrome d ubiquinol oxidase subunit II [Streptomyces sp. H27-C3]
MTTTALFAAHGAAFLALRSTEELAVRAWALAKALLTTAMAGAALAFLAAVAGCGADAVTNPLVATLLVVALLVALAAARLALTKGRSGRAFAATCCAAALPVLLIGAAQYPYVLVSTEAERFGMTATEGAADGATLGLLMGFGVVLIPVIVAYQFWSWWVFRGRVDHRTPTYF